ncbi:DUF421 domain-containing protein [Telmatocola sphagniphila]|uniref:DUF421 domain-containing protein n=1 Tax=Telmatocola sphagniphila TaxID=1123043 RepID=A0A8E6B825_9BACT|nr:YetF domain-containing protein [Telmatocola sphagniphila]QVL32841.1 DUF421 domain-containing protein [Telmatocola sphagniphila]
MFTPSVPIWELVIRAGIVYGFLLILLRITGKRQVGQLAPFDLVLLLVLANAVQNSINAGDNSVSGGLISATALVMLNFLVGMATYRSKTLESIIEGQPLVLIHNGHVLEKSMASAKLTRHELQAAMRLAGCAAYSDVQVAILENNGSISVVQHRDRKAAPPEEEPRP